MRGFLLSLCFVFLACGTASAAPKFPALTARVVDDAHMLSPGARQQLEQSLADYEAGTGNQLVVATIATLGGLPIEEYGVQLGRRWHIGQKGKDNGVLLIVAPKEHKVRIEVGYGFEGVLTDAQSSQIIQQIILPDFRSGGMEKGVVDGTQAILSVLGGKSLPAAVPRPPVTADMVAAFWIFFLGIIVFMCFLNAGVVFLPSGSVSRFGTSGLGGGWGGGGFGGFSGGGGSFGGGGASGGW